jgi:telomere length regulation protein
LQDIDNYDQQRLALINAASLIRRKTGFGSEIADHAEDLAARLIGLHDKFEMEDFQKYRLQGMIAIVVALPSRMGPWFAKTFFNGDYSTSQRASVLTTLGMAARELGGYKEQDSSLTGAKTIEFPTKMLPGRLHNLYTGQIDQLAMQLEHTMIKPMALEAADKTAGLDVLKVRTFSSRMETEKRRKRPIANELAKIVAESFFFPLTGRWWINLQA